MTFGAAKPFPLLYGRKNGVLGEVPETGRFRSPALGAGFRLLPQTTPNPHHVSNARLTASGSRWITRRRVAAGPLTRRVPCSHLR